MELNELTGTKQGQLWFVMHGVTIHGIYGTEAAAEARKQSTVAAGLATPDVFRIECDVWPNGDIDCY